MCKDKCYHSCYPPSPPSFPSIYCWTWCHMVWDIPWWVGVSCPGCVPSLLFGTPSSLLAEKHEKLKTPWLCSSTAVQQEERAHCDHWFPSQIWNTASYETLRRRITTPAHTYDTYEYFSWNQLWFKNWSKLHLYPFGR